MDLIQAIIFGILQGLTEFLPISSSAHIRILPALLGWQDPGAAFTANIQLGTLVAVLIYFWKDLGQVLKGWTGSLSNAQTRQSPEARIGWAIVVGTVPIIVLGFVLKDQIETVFRSLNWVAGALIIMALVLLAAEKFGKQTRDLNSVRPMDGLIVGLWQALALIPGCSRSGSTITGALFAGFDRATAARFSFLLSVPSIFLAAVYTAYTHREVFSQMLVPLLVANLFSLVSGYACIAFLMKFLQKNSTMVFIVYRILLGLAIIGLVTGGRLDPLAGIVPEPNVSTQTQHP